MEEIRCAVCESGLVREVGVRLATGAISGLLGVLFSKKAAGAFAAIPGYALGVQFEKWLCTGCGARFGAIDTHGFGIDPC